MLIACWSPKGGSGTTVVSVALGLALAATDPLGALVADLAGDVPAVLGLPDPTGLGLADWLAAETDVPDDALRRLEIDSGSGLQILPVGTPPSSLGRRAERSAALATALSADPRPVVADCGGATNGPPLTLATEAGVSLVVLRPCYLALRRALAAPIRPSGIVLVAERERALGARDIEQVLGAPVLTVVAVEPSIARAVDAGLLARRVPRPLATAAKEILASLPQGDERHGGSVRHLPVLRRAHRS